MMSPHILGEVSEGGYDEWVTVPLAAKLLGLQPRTIHALIDRGELPAEFTLPSPRPKSRRRAIRLRRQGVYDYIERSRVQPGELRRLYPSAVGGAYRSKSPSALI